MIKVSIDNLFYNLAYFWAIKNKSQRWFVLNCKASLREDKLSSHGEILPFIWAVPVPLNIRSLCQVLSWALWVYSHRRETISALKEFKSSGDRCQKCPHPPPWDSVSHPHVRGRLGPLRRGSGDGNTQRILTQWSPIKLSLATGGKFKSQLI